MPFSAAEPGGWDAWMLVTTSLVEDFQGSHEVDGAGIILSLSCDARARTWKHHRQLPRSSDWPNLNNSTLRLFQVAGGPNYPQFSLGIPGDLM